MNTAFILTIKDAEGTVQTCEMQATLPDAEPEFLDQTEQVLLEVHALQRQTFGQRAEHMAGRLTEAAQETQGGGHRGRVFPTLPRRRINWPAEFFGSAMMPTLIPHPARMGAAIPTEMARALV